MAFDGIIVSAAADELSGLLTGGKIEKIYQPEADELVFHIRAQSSNYRLYASSASSSARFHLLSVNLENPTEPTPFCMLLRKHLVGGRLALIEQLGSERILEITVDAVNDLGFPEGRKLIFEIMGKHSNIILIDAASRRIIDSIKRVSIDESRVRQVLPGKTYEYPPDQGKIPFKLATRDDIVRILGSSPSPLGKNLLGCIQGISPSLAEKLAASFVPGDADGESVFAELESMRGKLEAGDFTPVAYLDGNGLPVDFHIFPLPELESSCGRLEFDSVSKCIEYYYFSKTGLNRRRQKSASLEKSVRNSLDKLYLKRQRLAEDILSAEKADIYRFYGELLTANLHLIRSGAAEAVLTSYYDGQSVTIPLDRRLSPSKNAQAYFKKYGKSRTAIKEKTLRLGENDSDIKYLESVHAFIENSASAEEIDLLRNELIGEGYIRKRKNQAKRSKTRSAPIKYMTANGLTVMAGRNNTENDNLTFKTAGRADIWFHAKDIPGSHVILFTGGGEPPAADIFEAASIAAFHSKGKGSENVPVDYASVKYVKKPAGARPGMVIFTNNKTVYVNPKVPEAL